MIAGKPVNDAKIPAIAITNDNPLVMIILIISACAM